MSDLREYSFGDWVHLFLKAIPAYILATLIILSPLVVLAVFALAMRYFAR
jgi:hypothetical protein